MCDLPGKFGDLVFFPHRNPWGVGYEGWEAFAHFWRTGWLFRQLIDARSLLVFKMLLNIEQYHLQICHSGFPSTGHQIQHKTWDGDGQLRQGVNNVSLIYLPLFSESSFLLHAQQWWSFSDQWWKKRAIIEDLKSYDSLEQSSQVTSTDHHASEGVVHTLEKVLKHCFSWQYVDDVYFDKYDTESKSDLNDILDQVMQPATASILDTLQSDRFSCNHDNPQSSCFFLIFLQPKTFPMHWNCHSINLWPDNLKQPLSQYNETFFSRSQFNSFLAALEAHGLAEELSKPGLTNLTSLIGRRTAKILKRGKMNLLMVALLIHSILTRTMNIWQRFLKFKRWRVQWDCEYNDRMVMWLKHLSAQR